jgi:hypothetical protein
MLRDPENPALRSREALTAPPSHTAVLIVVRKPARMLLPATILFP